MWLSDTKSCRNEQFWSATSRVIRAVHFRLESRPTQSAAELLKILFVLGERLLIAVSISCSSGRSSSLLPVDIAHSPIRTLVCNMELSTFFYDLFRRRWVDATGRLVWTAGISGCFMNCVRSSLCAQVFGSLCSVAGIATEREKKAAI